MHPLALEELESHHLPITGLRSKSWNKPGQDFVALPIDRLDRLAIERKADEIGGLRIGLKWVAISR